MNTKDIGDVKAIAVIDMKSSCFYPFVKVFDEEAYVSYTVDRKHIRLSKFNLKKLVEARQNETI